MRSRALAELGVEAYLFFSKPAYHTSKPQIFSRFGSPKDAGSTKNILFLFEAWQKKITYWSLPGRAVEESLELQEATPLSKAVEEMEEGGYQVRNDPVL